MSSKLVDFIYIRSLLIKLPTTLNMNGLMAWYKSKKFYLFTVLLVHISLLDLFFVNHSGPVFLLDKNSELKTIFTHLFIVIISVVFYTLLTKCRNHGK